jgi:hypothetical protein
MQFRSPPYHLHHFTAFVFEFDIHWPFDTNSPRTVQPGPNDFQLHCVAGDLVTYLARIDSEYDSGIAVPQQRLHDGRGGTVS